MQLCHCPGRGPHSPSGPHYRSPRSPGLPGTTDEMLDPVPTWGGTGRQRVEERRNERERESLVQREDFGLSLAAETELVWTCQTGETPTLNNKEGEMCFEMVG